MALIKEYEPFHHCSFDIKREVFQIRSSYLAGKYRVACAVINQKHEDNLAALYIYVQEVLCETGSTCEILPLAEIESENKATWIIRSLHFVVHNYAFFLLNSLRSLYTLF